MLMNNMLDTDRQVQPDESQHESQSLLDTADIILFNGYIDHNTAKELIDIVECKQKSKECLLILVTLGGNPDVAYKMGKFIQTRFDKFTLLVSGLCKSAGTLLATAAEKLVFDTFGELGPLDVQIIKEDRTQQIESSLNIGESLDTLRQRAVDAHSSLVFEILYQYGVNVSPNTALHAATELIGSLYGPVFSQIDPSEVGSRARDMRISEQYALRLRTKWQNLEPKTCIELSRKYPSHSFVIDYSEACNLFHSVRTTTEKEHMFVKRLKHEAIYPSPRPIIALKIFNEEENDVEEGNAEEVHRGEELQREGEEVQ